MQREQQCLHECATKLLDCADESAGNAAAILHQIVQRHAAAAPTRRVVKQRCLSLFDGTRGLKEAFRRYLEVTRPDPERAPEMRHSYKLQYSPPTVILHVPRLKWYAGQLVRSQRAFTYPYQLAELAGMGSRYTLRAVAIHVGTATRGHYTAYTRRGARWTLYDDSSTRTIGLQEVMDQKKRAYLLVYTRQQQ